MTEPPQNLYRALLDQLGPATGKYFSFTLRNRDSIVEWRGPVSLTYVIPIGEESPEYVAPLLMACTDLQKGYKIRQLMILNDPSEKREQTAFYSMLRIHDKPNKIAFFELVHSHRTEEALKQMIKQVTEADPYIEAEYISNLASEEPFFVTLHRNGRGKEPETEFPLAKAAAA